MPTQTEQKSTPAPEGQDCCWRSSSWAPPGGRHLN